MFAEPFAHITPELCDEFQNGTKIFKYFPDSNDWSKIWNVVNKAALDCLKYLQVKGHIEENVYKDHEVDLRIAYNKDPNFLIPIVASYIDNFRRLIIGESELTEQLRNVETCFREGTYFMSQCLLIF